MSENHHAGIVVTTTDTPQNTIFIRFYMLFYIFEKEYIIGNQTAQQIADCFENDLADNFNKTVYNTKG